MDESPTWGRTYWGGALFCLQADVAHARADRATEPVCRRRCEPSCAKRGGYRAERDIDEVLRIGDAATGTRVLQDLYRETRRPR